MQPPPDFPVGPFLAAEVAGPAHRASHIAILAAAPQELQAAVAGLSAEQLGTKYRHWTLRQIVRHLADSHINSYIRCKLALTEDRPTIKPYDESLWASLPDAQSGSVDAALMLFTGLHACWHESLTAMTDAEVTRAFFHPETGQTVTLESALAYYAWHARHHTAQIQWRRGERWW